MRVLRMPQCLSMFMSNCSVSSKNANSSTTKSNETNTLIIHFLFSIQIVQIYFVVSAIERTVRLKTATFMKISTAREIQIVKFINASFAYIKTQEKLRSKITFWRFTKISSIGFLPHGRGNCIL